MQTTVPEVGWSDAKKVRVAAARRQRRVIFNDDTYELSREDANTPEGFLSRRLKPLAGTHVDTISFSVLGGWCDCPIYDSKIQPIYGDAHGGPPEYWPLVTRNVHALAESGRCPLQIVIDFARENGMEILASMRMNDAHDSFIPGGISMWKRKHPELLVDTKGRLPQFEIYTSCQDFSNKEVQDRKFEIVEELFQRYDVDGFELDFIRHPVFFSRTMRGEPATVKEQQIMTSFMGRIRRLTDETGSRRGRPLLLAMRVPDSFELSRRIGLDLRTWLAEDLVDILIAGGGYAPFSLPVGEFTRLAHRYGVLVYPCINRLPGAVPEDDFLEGVRALAANWYEAGADGIYFWNLGTPLEYKTGEELVEIRQRYYAPLYELGEPGALAGKDKLFCVDGAVMTNYVHISSEPPLPVASKPVYPGLFMRVPLMVGDDVQAAAESGVLAGAKLTVKLRGPDRREALLLRVNGEPLTDGEFLMTNAEESEYELSYDVAAASLRKGGNFVEGSLEGGWDAPIRPQVEVCGMRLKVEYKAKA